MRHFWQGTGNRPLSFGLRAWCLNWLVLLIAPGLKAQIPVEIFAGHERSTVDILFFRYFKNQEKENSRFLFFNRNRASIDYRQTSIDFLPVLGFTEAVSYNAPQLKGLAPVVVGQVLSWGAYAKAGVQYVYLKPHLTLFSWCVAQLRKQPELDAYLLLRYTPDFSEAWGLFSQLETLNVFPSQEDSDLRFTQRLRLGLRWMDWQFGAGWDLGQVGRETFSRNSNGGVFLRHVF